jgi:hypothetical protein
MDMPWTTNEECCVFGLVEDILGIEEAGPIYMIRDRTRRIEALNGSWEESGYKGGVCVDGVFYICADTATPRLKQTGYQYISLIMGCGYNLSYNEKESRKMLRAKMRELLLR